MSKRRAGLILVILGAVLIISALLLFAYNRWEDANAGSEAEDILGEVQSAITDGKVEDGESDDETYPLSSRTEGNRLVRIKGDKRLIGLFVDVKVTDSNTWALYGEV